MSTRLAARICTIIICFGVLLWSGCAHFLQPEKGVTARADARISLADNITTGIRQTEDLCLTFALEQKVGEFSLVGKLVVDRSISDSFPLIAKLIFYLSFLDADGRVIESFDIAPVINTFGSIPESLPVKLSGVRPPGSKAIAFSYYGEFRSNSKDDGDHWSIHHNPFD
jgi:hypothetical protein